MNVKIFADGADKDIMLKRYKDSKISGLTTNPTLMRKSGVKDYKKFALDLLSEIKDKPLSFEVFSDDFDTMEKQALEIASWGDNVYVKIPITNTKGDSSFNLIEKLGKKGVNINVTAITTIEQVKHIIPAISNCPSGFISVFAGRIADTGVSPLITMINSVNAIIDYPNLEIIWASCREIYNIIEADNIGCHIITVTDDILNKMSIIGKDLNEYSLDTVKMFYNDAKSSKFTI